MVVCLQFQQKKTADGEDNSEFELEEPIQTSKKKASVTNSSSKSKKGKPAELVNKDDDDDDDENNDDEDDDDPEADFVPTTRRSMRILTMKKREPDPDFELSGGDEVCKEYLSDEVDLDFEEDSEDEEFRPTMGRNQRRQAALKSKWQLSSF
jgi:hypothetical protein